MAADHAHRAASGRHAEAAARAHLLQAGLREVASNARAGHGELDLVMLDTDAGGRSVLVFVEVRHRRGRGFGGAAASVDAHKQRKLIRAAQGFLQQHPDYARHPCRFDVVESGGDPAHPTLNWIRDAFQLS